MVPRDTNIHLSKPIYSHLPLLNLPNAFNNRTDGKFGNDDSNLSDFKYYSMKEFNNLNLTSRNFSLFHTNIRSIEKNLQNLEIFLDQTKNTFDIIALSELWCPTTRLDVLKSKSIVLLDITL